MKGSETPKVHRDYSDLTAFLGEWGPFQRDVFLLLSLSTVPNGYAGMAMVFLSDTPRHHCRVPYLGGANLSQALPTELAQGEMGLCSCARYKWLNGTTPRFSNETESCLDGWEYSTEQYTSTIVTEWDLVCENAWKVPISLSIFFMGVLTGSLVSGQISDRFGRKTVLFITMAVQTLFSLIQVASVSWEMFCILFFIAGIGQISNYVAAFILGTELLEKSSRVTFSTLGVCVFYALGYTVLPLFAYFIRSWRMLLFVLTLPGILYVPLWWLIPESPRWLLAQGRILEAEAIVRAAAKKNGVTPPDVIFRTEESVALQAQNVLAWADKGFTPTKTISGMIRGIMGSHRTSYSVSMTGTDSTNTTYTYLDLVRTGRMRNITVLSVLIWLIISVSYFGLSLNTPNMSGDPYVNCLLSALSEVGAYTGVWLLLKVAPRQAVISSSLLSAGTVLLLIQIIPNNLGSLSVALAMAGKLGITAAFSVVYISAVELFPTVVRGMGVGICSTASKIGSTFSPFFPFVGIYDKALPYILMGALTLAVGLISLLLPETRGVHLPENLAQVQALNCCCLHPGPAYSEKGKNPDEMKEHQLNYDQISV